MSDKRYDDSKVPIYTGHGPHVLLVWWTHGEQNHIIVARTEKAAKTAWNSVFYARGNGDAKPVSFWKVDVVGLPADVRKKWWQATYQNDVDDFAQSVQSAICTYEFAHDEAQPPGVTPCKEYRSRWGTATDTIEDPSDHRSHYSCANCVEGWAFGGITVEELCRRKAYLFRKEEAEGNGPMPRTAPPSLRCDLPLPDPSRPLLTVTACGGHHEAGIGIGPAKAEDPVSYAADLQRWRSALLFFHGEKLPLPEWATSLRRVADTSAEVYEAAQKIAREKHNRERDEAHDLLVKKLFDGLDEGEGIPK